MHESICAAWHPKCWVPRMHACSGPIRAYGPFQSSIPEGLYQGANLETESIQKITDPPFALSKGSDLPLTISQGDITGMIT